MRINYALNERSVHRAFPKQPRGRRRLFVFDRDLRPFFLKVCWSGKRTFFVRVTGKLGRSDIRLGTIDKITASEARTRALEEIRNAQHQADVGPSSGTLRKSFCAASSGAGNRPHGTPTATASPNTFPARSAASCVLQ